MNLVSEEPDAGDMNLAPKKLDAVTIWSPRSSTRVT